MKLCYIEIQIPSPVPTSLLEVTFELQGLPARIYGLAVHPTSEIGAMRLVGGEGPLLTEGAPLVWSQGRDRDDVKTWKFDIPVYGRFVVAVAETPEEIACLPMHVANARNTKRSASFGLAGTFLSGALHLPRGTREAVLYVPEVPDFSALGAAGHSITLYLVGFARRPTSGIPTSVDGAASGSPGWYMRAFYSADIVASEGNPYELRLGTGAMDALFTLDDTIECLSGTLMCVGGTPPSASVAAAISLSARRV